MVSCKLRANSSCPALQPRTLFTFQHAHLQNVSSRFQVKPLLSTTTSRVVGTPLFSDMEENNKRNESIGSNSSKNGVKEISRSIPIHPGNVVNVEREKITPPSVTNEHTIGEVNMEASVTPDDVIRAGGFGARDDISSFLPVASDSTDFEATLVDARTYEEAKGEISRPGLGWREATTKN